MMWNRLDDVSGDVRCYDGAVNDANGPIETINPNAESVVWVDRI